ncbi:MAG TPA: hypothetical protein VK509_01140 [Polyangiales bacterium]|nr:hypothetical protein [Polyangiales bacterium]
MADKLQRLFEYWVLRSLPPGDDFEQVQQRLERLQRQLHPGVPTLDERDPYTLLTEPLPVEFAHAGKFRMGNVVNAAADGLAVATSDPPALGQRISLHVHDRNKGSVYAFVGCVVSRVIAGTQGMSVALEGTPKQTRVASNSSGVWRAAEEEEQQQGSAPRPLPGRPAGTGTIPGMPSRKQRGQR